MFYTDNPVMDAEMYDRAMEREMERSRRGKCAYCRETIYGCDEYYDFDGELVHDECLIDWAAQYRKGV